MATAAAIVGLAATFGNASYRLGTARIRAAVDAAEPSCPGAPHPYRRIDGLAARLGVAPPRLSVAAVGQPNALALGSVRDADAVLDDLLFRPPSAPESDAIAAHEPAHLKRRNSSVEPIGYSLAYILTGLVRSGTLPVALPAVDRSRATAILRGDEWDRVTDLLASRPPIAERAGRPRRMAGEVGPGHSDRPR